MLGKKATKNFLWQAMEWKNFFLQQKLSLPEILFAKILFNQKLHVKKRLIFFNLDLNKKTILAFGGSLGAKSINEFIAARLQAFRELDLQIIWQTGKKPTVLCIYRVASPGRMCG